MKRVEKVVCVYTSFSHRKIVRVISNILICGATNYLSSECLLTRCGILSTVFFVYVPLRFKRELFLLVNRFRKTYAETAQLGLVSFSDDSIICWARWNSDILLLWTFNIQLCLKPNDFRNVVITAMHDFRDVSVRPYWQCSCIRLIDDQ